jgi:hypothetical protein
MSDVNYNTVINNKRIYDYYNENRHVNVETMNIILLDFMEQLGNDMTKIISNTVFGEILSNVKEIKQQVYSLNDQLTLKLQEHNKSFIESVKLVIGMASNENYDKVSQLLLRNTDHFIEKINNSIPKTNDDNNKKIQENLTVFQKSINDDIISYLSANNNETSFKEFILNLDSKMVTMQQPIYTFISSNQEQLNTKLNSMRDMSISNKSANDKVMSDLNDFLTKYKTSSQFKGQCSENMLGNLLNKMYPTAEVINTTALKACGDFLMKRSGKQTILFENKNYEANVNIDEIKKFLRDVNEQKTHAIMLSQFSGIVSKPNGFIEINDGKVIIYLHNVDYSQEKIKMAIDVIDILSDRLEDISNVEEDGYVVKKDTLDKINDEFQKFINQKDVLLGTIKDMNKKLMSQVEDMKMPNLSLFLNDKYASIQNKQFNCDVCNLPFQNKRSLASHKKIHKNSNSNAEDNVILESSDHNKVISKEEPVKKGKNKTSST